MNPRYTQLYGGLLRQAAVSLADAEQDCKLQSCSAGDKFGGAQIKTAQRRFDLRVGWIGRENPRKASLSQFGDTYGVADIMSATFKMKSDGQVGHLIVTVQSRLDSQADWMGRVKSEKKRLYPNFGAPVM